MTALSHLATRIGDLLAAPAAGSAGALLVMASLLFTVVALLLFKWATPQRRLAEARGRLIGRLYESALYQADLGVIMRVQSGVLLANLRYLAMALPAVVVLVVPLLLVLPQLEARLGRRSLEPGEAVLVTAAVAGDVVVDLTAAPGLAVEAGPVRDRARGELVWRVRAVEPGRHRLRASWDSGDVDLVVPVAQSGLGAITAARHGDALGQMVFDPAGDTVPSGAPIQRLAVAMPVRRGGLAGLGGSWLVGFTVLSLAAGLLLKGALKVEL